LQVHGAHKWRRVQTFADKKWKIWKQGGSSRSPGYIALTLGLCQLTPSDWLVYKEADSSWLHKQ